MPRSGPLSEPLGGWPPLSLKKKISVRSRCRGFGERGGHGTDGVVEQADLREVFAALRILDVREFFQPLGGRLVRRVRRVEGQVEHPRLVFIAADKTGGLVAERDGEMRRHVVDGLAAADQRERVLALVRLASR